MTSTAFQLAEFLPYQLSVASNAVSNRIERAYRETFGLKITEWRVMAVLGDAGGLTQRELTERTLMDKVAVNRACKVLEQRELAERLPNEKDGRSHHLELTKPGWSMHAKIVPMAREIEAQLLEPFSTEQREVFQSLLDQIRNQAGEA